MGEREGGEMEGEGEGEGEGGGGGEVEVRREGRRAGEDRVLMR